ncbi:MAG: SMC-Scp complex subunit ScpB [Clostridia bacterium]|nr:SMC-Scp complex subunit ScpB [Clostridia bacterium]
MENLSNILESLLFYSGDAVDKSLIKEKLNIKENELAKAIKELEKKYDENSGIILIKFKNKLQFATNSKYTESVDLVLKKTRERALSKTIIETAAIIAYKQPITRLEIEDIRGGAPADYAIRSLLEHKLIEVVGRKETLGRPLLFGTTDEFLKRFNLQNLNDLPDFNQVMAEIKELNQIGDNSQNLYKDYEVPDSEIQSEANIIETIKETKKNITEIKTAAIKEVEENLKELKLKTEKADLEQLEVNDNNEEDIIEEQDKYIEQKIEEDIDEEDDYEDEFDDEDDDDDYVDLSEIKEFRKN